MYTRLFIVFTAILFLTHNALSANAVWWEGESAAKNDFVKSDWLDKDIRKTNLSNLDWLSCYVKEDAADKKEIYSAEFEIDVPADSEYTLYAREFYRRNASPWKFRFDGGKWQEVTREYPSMKGTIDELGRERSVVWCKYGKFELSKGKHKFEIQISERQKKGFQAGFDAFLLADVPFNPPATDNWQKPSFMSAYEYIGNFHWLEGENGESNFTNKPEKIPEKNARLSSEKWLVCDADPAAEPAEGFYAKWKFVSQKSASCHFWVRELNRKDESPFLYRINNGKWKKALPSTTFFDPVDLTKDVSACWVNYKKLYVQEGENTIEIKIDGENKDGAVKLAIDCLLVTLEPYLPQGKLRPDAIVNPPEGWFVYRPQSDLFDENNQSAFDLRKLNERKTGSHGFCKVDNNGIVFKDGTRPRFWGINVYDPIKMDNDGIKAFVKQVAKFGVNLIRINGSLCDPDKGTFGEIDKDLFDRLCYFIYVCQNSGVYVALANYNPADYIIKTTDGIEGYEKNSPKNKPYGLLLTSKKYREIYKKWARFLKYKNPYNRLRLYKDPTIAWFEIKTGKGILSDALNYLPKSQKKKLDQEYNKWLIRRYGDLPYVLKSWSTPKKYHPIIEEDGRKGSRTFRILPFDSFKYSVLKNPDFDHFNKRKMDQLKFIAEYSNKINKELIDYLRKECNFNGIISVGDSDNSAHFILNGVDAYIKSAGDVVAYNRFINPIKPENINEILHEDSFVKSRSVLFNPFISPVMQPNYYGKANIISEVAWTVPNNYRGEAVPFVSAYSSLQGHNTYVWYQADSNSWVSRLTTYCTQSAGIMGMFPGYALMFRRGDIKESLPVISQKLSMDEVYDLQGDGLYPTDFSSQVRLRKIPDFKDKINPFSFLVGKVNTQITTEEKGFIFEKIKLDKYLNTKKSTVVSSTKELDLDYKYGQLTIDSPKAQGFTGFTRRGVLKKLKDVTLNLKNSFINILVISLDNKPLSSSNHILVQAFSRENNNGWKTEKVPKENYFRLLDVGDSPLIVRNISANISMPGKASKGWKIWQLDANGYRIDELDMDESKNISFDFPEDGLYVELEKK